LNAETVEDNSVKSDAGLMTNPAIRRPSMCSGGVEWCARRMELPPPWPAACRARAACYRTCTGARGRVAVIHVFFLPTRKDTGGESLNARQHTQARLWLILITSRAGAITSHLKARHGTVGVRRDVPTGPVPEINVTGVTAPYHADATTPYVFN